MKGVVPHALSKLIIENYGVNKWLDALERAGIQNRRVYLPIENVPDEEVFKLVEAVSDVLNISTDELISMFGKYWINTYAYKMYKPFYNVENAREFILKLPDIHKQVVANIEGATPPEFRFEWLADNVLLMHYKSPRNLIDLGIGLLRGVADYFDEDIKITKINNNTLQLEFNYDK